jgi:hypothetical protein
MARCARRRFRNGTDNRAGEALVVRGHTNSSSLPSHEPRAIKLTQGAAVR